jgi:serine/threonine-protein phosphatase 4 regulatory subunit 1
MHAIAPHATVLVMVDKQDLCQQFVTPDMVSLSEDPVFRVRKATALNLHHICRIAGEQDSRDRLLPAYIRLTKDDMYR